MFRWCAARSLAASVKCHVSSDWKVRCRPALGFLQSEFATEAAVAFAVSAVGALGYKVFEVNDKIRQKELEKQRLTLELAAEKTKNEFEKKLLAAQHGSELATMRAGHEIAKLTSRADTLLGTIDIRGAFKASLLRLADCPAVVAHACKTKNDVGTATGASMTLFTDTENAFPGLYNYLKDASARNNVTVEQILESGCHAFNVLSKRFKDGSRPMFDKAYTEVLHNNATAIAVGSVLRFTGRSPEFYDGGKFADDSGKMLAPLPPGATTEALLAQLTKDPDTGLFVVAAE